VGEPVTTSPFSRSALACTRPCALRASCSRSAAVSVLASTGRRKRYHRSAPGIGIAHLCDPARQARSLVAHGGAHCDKTGTREQAEGKMFNLRAEAPRGNGTCEHGRPRGKDVQSSRGGTAGELNLRAWSAAGLRPLVA
jgi:hypothetical protein